MFLLLDGTNIYNMSGTNAEGTSLYLPCVHVWCIVTDRRFVTEQMNEKIGLSDISYDTFRLIKRIGFRHKYDIRHPGIQYCILHEEMEFQQWDYPN